MAQRRVLRELVAKAAGTRFGRQHDFADFRTVEDFQRRVPLRTYGQLWDEFWKSLPRARHVTWPGRMPFFAVSSGTASGKVKHIPCSREMVRSNARAALEPFVHHLGVTPDSRILDGSLFMLGGSTDLKELAPGVRAATSAASRPTAGLVEPPLRLPAAEVALHHRLGRKDRHDRPLSLERTIRGISGALAAAVSFEKLASLRPGTLRRIADIYPDRSC